MAEVPDPTKWGRMGTRNRSRGSSSAVWRREFSAKYAENRAGEAMNPLPLPVAESPRVSLAAAAVQARRGPARPEPGIEISGTSETESSFLNCPRVFESPRGHQLLQELTARCDFC